CLPLGFFFAPRDPTEFHSLSLHDALPISLVLEGSVLMNRCALLVALLIVAGSAAQANPVALSDTQRVRLEHGEIVVLDVLQTHRSEEHTSELQSRSDLVCRLLLEKKNRNH